MVHSNRELVGRGLDVLMPGLAPYVLRELKRHYNARWWKDGIEAALRDTNERNLSNASVTEETRFEKFDISVLLSIMIGNWKLVFDNQLHNLGRSYVGELKVIRNEWAHQHQFTTDDAFRAIDTMARLAKMIGASERVPLEKLASEFTHSRNQVDTIYEGEKSSDVFQTGVSNMSIESIPNRIRKLNGKHVTTMSGTTQFHIYEVNDTQVKYDPEKTKSPGAHWSYMTTFTRISDLIQHKGRRAQSPADIQILYDELGISSAEGQTTSYVFGILCAIDVIHHDKAGNPSDCRNSSCPGRTHAQNVP